MIRMHSSVGNSSDDRVQCPPTNAEKTGCRVEEDHTSRTFMGDNDDEGHGAEHGVGEGQMELLTSRGEQGGMQIERESISIEVGNDTQSAVLFYINMDAPSCLAPALSDPSVTLRWRVCSSQTDPLTLIQCEPENVEHAKMFFHLLHTEVTRGNRR